MTNSINLPEGNFRGHSKQDVWSEAPDLFLAEVGPGTPCGEYQRRFWMPVAMTNQFDDKPYRIRTLGEDLVLFREKGGQLGLVHLHCAHRNMSLEYGIIEEGGIRCSYHGWKYNVDGTVLETPCEPKASKIKEKVCLGAYPVVEYKGLAFTFMGPPDKMPPFPFYDTFDEEGAEILPYLERLRDEAGLPMLYVSHAIDEIARLADTLVVLQDGLVMRAGPALELFCDPDAVPLIGVRDAGAVLVATIMAYDSDGLCALSVSGGTVHLPGVTGEIGRQLRLRVLAQDIILATERPQNISALNILPVVVTSLRYGDGPGVAVGLQLGDEKLLARITKRSATQLGLERGQSCFAILKATTVARGSIGQN